MMSQAWRTTRPPGSRSTAVKWVELPRDPDLASGDAPPEKWRSGSSTGRSCRAAWTARWSATGTASSSTSTPSTPDSPVRKLGIPFSAVKALFFIREFDARGEEAGSASEGLPGPAHPWPPLLDVLEEMDNADAMHRDGLLSDDGVCREQADAGFGAALTPA